MERHLISNEITGKHSCRFIKGVNRMSLLVNIPIQRTINTLYRPEICLQIFVCYLEICFYLILSLYYHIEAELGSAEEQPNKEYI